MIFINGKFLTQRKTGVQRFAYELTKQLIQSGLALEIVIPQKLAVNDSELPDRVLKRTGIFQSGVLWEQIDLSRYLKTKKNPLLLSFCNSGPVLSARQIVCIHDMSYYFNPAWFSRKFYFYYKYLIPRLAASALHILTVSNFSKHEICDKLNIKSKNVSIVNNAPSSAFVASGVEAIVQKKSDFFLFVGSHDPRKNIALLLKTFSLKEYSLYRLVIVGDISSSFRAEELALPPNIKLIKNCDDATLANYYKHAIALINPSYYEGFGLPLIEAMASGCPLVISDIAAFKEVAKQNACYFNPDSQSSFKIALNNLLRKTESELLGLIISNYQESLKYTWKLSFNQLKSIMENLNYDLNS